MTTWALANIIRCETGRTGGRLVALFFVLSPRKEARSVAMGLASPPELAAVRAISESPARPFEGKGFSWRQRPGHDPSAHLVQ